MTILQQLMLPFQAAFSKTNLGRERADWFVWILLAIIVPFTSSISSNLLRSVQTLFGLELTQRRFYTFMASPKLPWQQLWRILWGVIPNPTTYGRLIVALDDFINPKIGRHVFGCATIFDHAAKANQSSYPWAQNIVTLGLLTFIKGRWACLPLACRFYLPQSAINNKSNNMKRQGSIPTFKTKLAQAVEMLESVAKFFTKPIILVVTDSWFGNNGLFKPARKAIGQRFHLLSRLRSNANLFGLPSQKKTGKRGRPLLYGESLGSVSKMAAIVRKLATSFTVNTYGKSRTVLAYTQIVMLKTIKQQVRVVWVFRSTQWVALFTTDLDLSVEQIIEIYAARWKIEAAFKELKQEIGSQRSQTRNAVAVSNHLQLCMMAMSVTWSYADLLQPDPKRRHIVKGRASFAFSDVRYLLARAAMTEDFNRLCPTSRISASNPIIQALMRLAA